MVVRTWIFILNSFLMDVMQLCWSEIVLIKAHCETETVCVSILIAVIVKIIITFKIIIYVSIY